MPLLLVSNVRTVCVQWLEPNAVFLIVFDKCPISNDKQTIIKYVFEMKTIFAISCVGSLAGVYFEKVFLLILFFFLLSFVHIQNGISYFWLKFIEFDTNKTNKARKKNNNSKNCVKVKSEKKKMEGKNFL